MEERDMFQPNCWSRQPVADCYPGTRWNETAAHAARTPILSTWPAKRHNLLVSHRIGCIAHEAEVNSSQCAVRGSNDNVIMVRDLREVWNPAELEQRNGRLVCLERARWQHPPTVSVETLESVGTCGRS